MERGAWRAADHGVSKSGVQLTQVRSLGREDPLEKGLATSSSVLAWRIPWTEEPGGLLQYSCLENPTDRGAWWATVHGVTESQIQLSD